MRALAIACVLTSALCAEAAPGEPIVVSSDDPAFAGAVIEALAPAGMRVVPAVDPPPKTIGDVNAASRAMAEREHATATVWMLFDPERGATLVTYDRDVDRVLVRGLRFTPPLDAAQAAEAARMARTMLRALRVTPDVDLPPPLATEAPALRARAAAMPVEHVVVPPEVLAIEAIAGGRVGAPSAKVDVEGTVAAIWRPDAIGAVLAVAFSPNNSVMHTDLTGAIGDTSIAALGRVPWRPSDRLGVAAAAGVAVHRLALSGTVAEMAVRSTSYDPAARIGATLTYDVGSVGVGLDVSLDWLLRRQAYDVGGGTTLEVPRAQVSVGLCLLARIL